jgi:hypothetical protein
MKIIETDNSLLNEKFIKVSEKEAFALLKSLSHQLDASFTEKTFGTPIVGDINPFSYERDHQNKMFATYIVVDDE